MCIQTYVKRCGVFYRCIYAYVKSSNGYKLPLRFINYHLQVFDVNKFYVNIIENQNCRLRMFILKLSKIPLYFCVLK